MNVNILNNVEGFMMNKIKKYILILIFTVLFSMSNNLYSQDIGETLKKLLGGLNSINPEVSQMFPLIDDIYKNLERLAISTDSSPSPQTLKYIRSMKNKKLTDMDIILLITKIVVNIEKELKEYDN